MITAAAVALSGCGETTRISGDQCGSAGDDFELVSRSAGIDVLEYHDYEQAGSLAGHESAGLAARIRQARAVDKPLVVAEIGMPAGACRSIDERYAALVRIIDEQRAQGTAGALLWAFMPEPRLSECTLDIGPDDPLLDLVGKPT